MGLQPPPPPQTDQQVATLPSAPSLDSTPNQSFADADTPNSTDTEQISTPSSSSVTRGETPPKVTSQTPPSRIPRPIRNPAPIDRLQVQPKSKSYNSRFARIEDEEDDYIILPPPPSFIFQFSRSPCSL